jgi:hypothetical protein
LLVGKNMPGMQTVDVLRSFDYLRSRPDVNAARISVTGKGKGGILALFVAVLEPRIAKAESIGAAESYMDIVRMKIHDGITDLVIPGVLHDFDLPDLVKAVGPRYAVR